MFGDGSGANSLYQRQGLEGGWGLAAQSREEVVRLETLDGCCQRAEIQAIDFIKIDVEGHELEVLRGTTDILAKGGIRFIQFEYGGCNMDARVLLKDLFDLSLAKNCGNNRHQAARLSTAVSGTDGALEREPYSR